MPSLAIPLWLVFAASAQADSLSPPSQGREAVTKSPLPATSASKVSPTVAKPSEPKAPKLPVIPVPATTAPLPAINTAKTPQRLDLPPPGAEEPEEEILGEHYAKTKARNKKSSRKPAPVERPEFQERKSTWTTDRYAAVVPPGLTLAALRSQLAKSPTVGTEPAPAPAERSQPNQTLSDIEKAREALRQETARLEALLRATGNCGGGMGMTIGDPLLPAAPVSAAALQEASNEQIDSVSKAMKGMKPEQAAAMVARMDHGLAAEILRRMKANDAGAILGLLKPELSAELATVIATRKSTFTKEKKGTSR